MSSKNNDAMKQDYLIMPTSGISLCLKLQSHMLTDNQEVSVVATDFHSAFLVRFVGPVGLWIIKNNRELQKNAPKANKFFFWNLPLQDNNETIPRHMT